MVVAPAAIRSYGVGMEHVTNTTHRPISTLAGHDLIASPFMALRADWLNQGMPSDHPYLRIESPNREAARGLVPFADGSVYGG